LPCEMHVINTKDAQMPADRFIVTKLTSTAALQ